MSDMPTTSDMSHDQVRELAVRAQAQAVALQEIMAICGEGHPAYEIARKTLAGKKWQA